MRFLLLALLLVSGCDTPAMAQIDPNKAILAVIGEAENQGYEGMLAVAGAIRNRGSLRGVYGLRAPRVVHHRYTRHTLQTATLAWIESAHRDITKGATGWGNKADLDKFCSEWWWSRCIITIHIKDHWFYKELR